MWRIVLSGAVTLIFMGFFSSAQAHFQSLLPSADIIQNQASSRIAFDIRFTHPMEAGPLMEMDEPRQFGVLLSGKKIDLKSSLVRKKIDGHAAYSAEYTVAAPGDHVFYIEPAPYWEAVEKKSIVHFTKVVIDGFGAEQGWDELVGFPVEIQPLVRPYGLWTGNLFRGVVLKEGKPLPHAVIEVEYWNQEKKVAIPAAPFVTQTVKADAQGVFAYSMPIAGWWGFAALVDEERLSKADANHGENRELGGLIWVRVEDMR